MPLSTCIPPFIVPGTEPVWHRSRWRPTAIYTAKTVRGRYIGPRAPFGYKKEYRQEGKKRLFRLIVNEEEATIVRWIYDAYPRSCPLYLIKEDATKLADMEKKRGNFSISSSGGGEGFIFEPLIKFLRHVEQIKMI